MVNKLIIRTKQTFKSHEITTTVTIAYSPKNIITSGESVKTCYILPSIKDDKH